jgi:hypothetical protein
MSAINVGDWVRIDVDECGAPVGSVVLVVKIDSIGNIVIYNYNGYLTFYADRRNVSLERRGGGQ